VPARAKSRTAIFSPAFALAFGATVVTNGVRIVLAAHLYQLDVYSGAVTAERVHQVLDRAYAMPADVVKIASEALNITGASDAN